MVHEIDSMLSAYAQGSDVTTKDLILAFHKHLGTYKKQEICEDDTSSLFLVEGDRDCHILNLSQYSHRQKLRVLKVIEKYKTIDLLDIQGSPKLQDLEKIANDIRNINPVFKRLELNEIVDELLDFKDRVQDSKTYPSSNIHKVPVKGVEYWSRRSSILNVAAGQKRKGDYRFIASSDDRSFKGVAVHNNKGGYNIKYRVD